MEDFEIIRKTTGKASQYAKYVVELYEIRNGKTEQIENALKRLKKDAVWLKENKSKDEILLCFKTDPYTVDYCETITRSAIKILDDNELKYVIRTEDGMRAYPDFEQMKRPKNVIFISKIVFDLQGKTDNGKLNGNFIEDLLVPIKEASQKGIRTGIEFNPKSDPILSLELIRKFYQIVNQWNVGDDEFEPKTANKSTWKKFKKDTKAKDLFKILGGTLLWTKDVLKINKKDPRLLLIAPHGVATKPQDDINTDKLVIKIAERLNCRVIVNDAISRLYLDLNKVNEAKKHKKFISAVENAVKTPGRTLVVWIHGIGDDNLKTEIQKLRVKEDIQCFIGYGRGQPDRLTAEKKTVDNIIRLFKDNSIIAQVARDWSNYCGHSTSLMNQWLRLKGYKLPNAQSIQLEFKEEGIRTDEDLEAASHNIAKALSELVDFKYHVEQPTMEAVESEQSGEEIATNIQAEQLEIIDIPVETEPAEMKLVEEAYHHLATIFSKHYENAMFEAGQYIIEKFYSGDIELAKDNKPAKKASLRKLEDLLKIKNPNSPSKSWLHYSIQLFVETNEIKENELNTTVQTYGQLPVSHKILLFPVRTRDTKIELIQETVQNNYTYVQLKNRIAELKTADKSKIENRKSLLQIINNPDLLFSDNYADDREENSLSKLNLAKLEKIYKKTEAKLSDIENDFEEIKTKLTMHREYDRNYKQLLKSVERAKEKGKVGISESRVKRRGRNRWELTSALQKSIRWCEVNESRYFARELMDMGIPGAVFNRLIIIPAEDVGLADPSLIVYERQCSDHFEKWIKQNKIKKSEAVKFPELCEIVDRAVIAAAISYKSRLLPQLSFATLFDIWENEDFSKNLSEYLDRFVLALKNEDEKQATYYAYVVSIFLNSEDNILKIVQKHSGMRNKDLIQKWVEEYRRNNELLMLAGSIVLLCRDLPYHHGEYNDAVYQYLSVPIKKVEIPDRAYDMHTSAGARKRRGLEHFFDEGATVKNERFSNDWEQAGRTAYISANQKGLGKAAEIIKTIKKNYEKSKESQKREGIYSSASV